MTMAEIRTMDTSGDSKFMWDKDNPDEVAVARDHFNALKKKGYMAHTVEGKDGKKGTVIRNFDPEAERVIMVPPMRGG